MSAISVNIDEIGQKWGALLTQAMVQTAQLEAQVKACKERIEALEGEIDRLRPMLPATWDGPDIVRDGNKKAALVDG